LTAGIDFSLHGTLDLISGRRPRPLDAGSGFGDPLDPTLGERDTASRAFASRMWPINTAAPQWNGLGTYDVPQAFGPMPGFVWVVRSVTAATFTAGTIGLYKGLPADNNLRYVFTAAGAFYPGGSGLILVYGDRLTFAPVTAVTGLVTLSLEATQMTADLLPRFLM
jgi:hypothetical protein